MPHPRTEYSEAIELDHGMTGGVMKVEIRAATAGYLLRQWYVDCTKAHSLKDHEYQLWLKNTPTLYGGRKFESSPKV